MNLNFNQLSIFNSTDEENSLQKDLDSIFSNSIYESFEEINFNLLSYRNQLVCDYEKVSRIIPCEEVSFSEFPLYISLTCELLCASICNNINWDYLRKAIFETIKINTNWISISHLKTIKSTEIDELFKDYKHPEKVNSKMRASLLRELAVTYENDGFESIFFDKNNNPQNYNKLRESLLKCKVFSCDPIEKKIQLLVMKISKYDGFQNLVNECKPTIDYHIIRTFIRRGYLIMKNSNSIQFINTESIHREKTIAAVRKHCANIIYRLSDCANLSVLEINSIEWWVGRSICTEKNADCELLEMSSNWLKPSFNRCPFYNYCFANSKYKQLSLFSQEESETFLKTIEGPNYSGNSF